MNTHTLAAGVCAQWPAGTYQFSLLVPGGLAHPAEGEACICADLDGGRFCFSDGLLHWLHQILGVVHQHLGGLVGEQWEMMHVRDGSKRFNKIAKTGNKVTFDTLGTAQTDLFWLLLTDVCPSQHGGFDGREDLQLGADGGDSFADLVEQNKSACFSQVSSLIAAGRRGAHLQQIGPDAPVRALLGHFFGQPCHLVWGLGDILGALNQRPFVPAPAAHEPRHFGHEQSHPLGRRNDVITLWRWVGGTVRAVSRMLIEITVGQKLKMEPMVSFSYVILQYQS